MEAIPEPIKVFLIAVSILGLIISLIVLVQYLWSEYEYKRFIKEYHGDVRKEK